MHNNTKDERGVNSIPKYKIDEIVSCGIECEDGKQFTFSETTSNEYVASEMSLRYAPDKKPQYYVNRDFDKLMDEIIRDHGKFTYLQAWKIFW